MKRIGLTALNSYASDSNQPYVPIRISKHQLLGDYPCREHAHFVPSDWIVQGFAAMGLYQIVEGLLLMTNAVAVLNENRFLVPMGLGFADMGNGRVSPFKGQLIGFIHAVQYLRVPLVVANGVVIVSKLLFG